MDHEQALLKEIVHNLDDDTPRLILADWYSERSDPRGDFIRTQCELARMDWDDPRYEELQGFEEALLAKHRAKWVKALPKLDGVAWGSTDMATSRTLWWTGRTYFRRGFIELVTYKDYPAFHKNAQAIANYGLVTHIQFLKMNAHALDMLGNNPFLRGTSHRQWDVNLPALGRFAALEKLELLSLHECSLYSGGLLQLMKIAFPSLQILDLAYNRLQFLSVDLEQWNSIKNVKWLNVSGNDFGERYVRPRESTEFGVLAIRNLLKLPFENLFVLDISSTSLSTPCIAEIAAAKSLNRLTELSLSWNNLTDDSIDPLAKGSFPTLRHLDLGTNALTDSGAVSLAGSPSLRTLRRLRLNDNQIGDEGIEAIAQSPHLSNLTHLNIPRLNFGLGGIEALIRSTTLNSIRYLNIGDIELNSKTLKDLQGRYPKAVVRKPYH